MVEKRWIAFQLLNALRDARNRKVSHGDIKSENILVTSWNWIYLTDFASYKPTYLPLNDPTDFSYFFDMSGRTCYIAPERFYTPEDNPEISAMKSKIAQNEIHRKRDGPVTEAMDCFSAGCVIAELFLEGAPLFNLPRLFQYKRGEYKVEHVLDPIGDEGVKVRFLYAPLLSLTFAQNLICQMISLDATNRPTFDTLLHTSRGTVFPEAFYSYFHNYVSTLNDLATEVAPPQPTPIFPQSNITPSISNVSMRSTNTPIVVETKTDALPNNSDRRIARIWADYASMESYIVSDTPPPPDSAVKVEYTSTMNFTSKPYQVRFSLNTMFA